jgi:hypothetical protein
MLRRAAWLTGVLVLVLLLALGGAAEAKKKKKKKRPTFSFTTHATLEFTGPGTFTGTVSAGGQPKSERAKCVEGRTVILYYYGPNAAPVTVLGIDKTDSNGRYRFQSEPFAFPGGYQLVAERLEMKLRKGKRIHCSAADTPVKSV